MKTSEIKKMSSYKDEVPLDAQSRLMQIMNDSPSIVKFAGTDWQITALKKGTQWLISEEICKIENIEQKTAGEAFKCVAKSMPSVCRIITLALLNDEKRINEEYETTYNTLLWKSEDTNWGQLLQEIFSLIDVGFFFQVTNAVRILKDMTTKRKMKIAEAESLSQGQNTGK